jgi:antitoxin component YwqK of YwqJK toxin-antitoxin module
MRYRGIVYFVFSIVLLFGSSCGSDTETQPEPKSEWKGNTSAFTENFEFRGEAADLLLYEKSQEIPFSGSVERKQANGDLSKEHYSKGVKHGLQVNHSLSGARSEATFVDGVLHGDVVTYNRQGRERTRMHYVRGTLARLLPPFETNGNNTE